MSRYRWVRVKVPMPLIQQSPGIRAWQCEVHDGHLSVFAGQEPSGFHMSISHRISNNDHRPGRYPTWDEIVDARYRFCPLNVTMAQLLPPQDQYANLHDTTFHLWQIQPHEEDR